MTRRRAFLRTLGATAATTGGLGVSTLVAGCLGTATPSTRTLLGACPGRRPASPATFRPLERWQGRRNAVLSLFYDADALPGDEDAVAADLETVWTTGHVPMVAWQPYLDGPAGTPSDIDRVVAGGGYDDVVAAGASHLSGWARRRRGPDRRLYLRPFPEMNGDWLPWSAADGSTTADFVAAWRAVHDAFVDAGLDGDVCQWVWNPNAQDGDGPPAEAYYPGDGYVDWVGVDGYNFGASQPWSAWQSPAEVFDPMLDRVAALTDKPVAIPEFASSSARDGGFDPPAKAAWITAAFDLVARRDVRLVAWFNLDKETDWPVFGGPRGTGTATVDGATYPVYGAYRRAVARAGVLGPQAGHPRRLTDEAFRGTW